ncbi:hypothetical protein AB0L04_30345 [Streptomyces glaucescens]|uniref:hypothetical protein n=1 Tax=Streptomyces glaucescens TaxID=1907 RepID=UPI0034503563
MVTQVPLPPEPNRSTAYADWAAAHDPGAARAARGLLDVVRDAIASAYPRTGRCVDILRRHADGLPAAHLPWFWDTVGHRLLAGHPRTAARAFALARSAERTHALPVDPDWRRANALLFARAGALPAKELGDHQRRLAADLAPAQAHREFAALVTAWAASPGELPADLARRIRASARAAGLGTAEDARLLGHALGAARGKAVPDALLEAATGPLADHPQDPAVLTALLDLFPESRNDAAAWLRLLLRCGAVDAAADGRLAPAGGLAGWLAAYTRTYGHRPSGGGLVRQPVPAELFEVVTRFAPRLRTADTPVRLHEDRYDWPGLDADLLDVCLAERIPVADPGDTVPLHFWGDAARRDLRALAADPVFGRRLEGTVHAALRGAGTAITRLPRNAGITAEVHTRVESLLTALRGGGLAAADEAVDELRTLLDRPTATALDGVDEALAALDLTGPLARALRSGLPEELGWPALEEALAGFPPGDTVRVTGTWPVLTLYGSGRAVAVDHAGPRASCAFRLPDDAAGHAVHYAGGRFLISWTCDERQGFGDLAFWDDRPEDVFEPEHKIGLRPYGGIIQGGYGFQFETPDGSGRHDGERVLRPGGKEGIGHHELQMSDGRRFWSAEVFHSRGNWTRFDPVTGARGTDRTLPGFHAAGEVPPGMEEFEDGQLLAALPEGAAPSPLGQDGRLVGCRVLNRTPYAGPSPADFLLESVDGRRARYRSRRPGRRPWAIIALPYGGEDAVLAGQETIRCHAAEDNSLLWQVHGFPGSGRRRTSTFGHGRGPVPPPAFWHFLTPRDERSSKALRTVGAEAVRALLRAARQAADDDALRERVTGILPDVTEPRIVDGVVRAARTAADVLRRREELSRRVGVMRAGPVVDLAAPVPDTDLAPALSGLLPELRLYEAYRPEQHPGTLTAVAADGRHLRGEIDEEARQLAPPSPPAEWQALLGRIDAVAWRAAVGTTPDADRAALAALLGTWSAQPFAAPGGSWRTGRAGERALAALRAAGYRVASGPARGGLARFLQPATDPAPQDAEETETVTVALDDSARLTRLLELVERHGPFAVPPEALAVFSWRTGVRRAVAALVLGGLPRREDHREHQRMLRSAPYRATKTSAAEYDGHRHRLGAAGRRAVLAAGVPEDPAELWTHSGITAAAERMAEAWAARLGTTPYADDELADALEQELGLPADWARALPEGRTPADHHGFVLVGDRRGGLDLHRAAPDGTAGEWVPVTGPGHLEAASVIAWALTERPVGDPAAQGAVQLHAALRAQLADPGTLVPMGRFAALARRAADDPGFLPYDGPVLPCPQPLLDGASPATAVDDGLLVVAVPSGDVFLRPAALADGARRERAAGLCGEPGLAWLGERLERTRALLDGLARLAGRAVDTPVPPGGYEANPALSAPGLVAGTARALGVGADAAALYLQLLALARPTDAAVRRWNGWTAARHKAAQAELVAVGAVVTGRRARAGRTAFVPGEWLDPKAPHLPLERRKLAAHLASASGKDVHAPFLRLLPPVPPHELFERAVREAPEAV